MARIALTEVKPDVSVEQRDDEVVVRRGDRDATFERASFIAGVSGRAGPHRLSNDKAELLSLGY